jgi:hypothetical protein
MYVLLPIKWNGCRRSWPLELKHVNQSPWAKKELKTNPKGEERHGLDWGARSCPTFLFNDDLLFSPRLAKAQSHKSHAIPARGLWRWPSIYRAILVGLRKRVFRFEFCGGKEEMLLGDERMDDP